MGHPDLTPEPPLRADRFRVAITWSGEEPLLPGRSYLLTVEAQTTSATVAPLRYRLDPATGEHVAATTLAAGETGAADFQLTDELRFTGRTGDRPGSRFNLADPVSEATVGSGTIEYALRRAANVQWQALSVDRAARARTLGQLPTALWLTGLSGAGKSTIANLVEAELHASGRHTYLLDGDNVRHGLNADLGFTDADRVENIRRVAEVAKLMVDAGLIVLVSFISPFRAERAMARSLFADGAFVEIHVDTPLAVAEERDPKGLYRKARQGELRNFTGIDSPYEPPDAPELRIDTTAGPPSAAARAVIGYLEAHGRLHLP